MFAVDTVTAFCSTLAALLLSCPTPASALAEATVGMGVVDSGYSIVGKGICRVDRQVSGRVGDSGVGDALVVAAGGSA